MRWTQQARLSTALVVGIAGLLVAGCGQGGPPADLFVVERDGAEAGARLTLRVADDGGAYCNAGERVDLSSQQLLDARELRRLLDGEEREEEPGLAAERFRLPPRPGSLVQFRVVSENGTIAFAENSRGLPSELTELIVLTRDIARDLCGLAR